MDVVAVDDADAVTALTGGGRVGLPVADDGQPALNGDVVYADTSPLERDFGFRPATPLREGLRRFARWYRAFYGPQS